MGRFIKVFKACFRIQPNNAGHYAREQAAVYQPQQQRLGQRKFHWRAGLAVRSGEAPPCPAERLERRAALRDGAHPSWRKGLASL